MKRLPPSLCGFFTSLGRAMVAGFFGLISTGVVCGAELASSSRMDAGACQSGMCSVLAERIVFCDSAYGAGGLPVEVRYPGSPDGSGAVSDGVFPLLVFGCTCLAFLESSATALTAERAENAENSRSTETSTTRTPRTRRRTPGMNSGVGNPRLPSCSSCPWWCSSGFLCDLGGLGGEMQCPG